MNLLAIETATIEVGVALWRDGDVIAVRERVDRRHVETVHVAIEAVLSRGGLGVAALDALAIDVGPGRFTGLRVGIGTAMGLALARSIPIAACTSLQILHHGAGQAAPDRTGEVVAVVDMRRGELAWSVDPSQAPVLGDADALVAALAGLKGPICLVGDGAQRARATIERSRPRRDPAQVVFGDDELAAPPVGSLAMLGQAVIAAGGGKDPAEVEPCYLRGVDAKINWSTREQLGAGRS